MLRKCHPVQKTLIRDPFPFEIYRPAGAEGKLPVIFQTPILGQFSLFEDLFFERRWARFFAENGFMSVLIHRPIFDFDAARGLEQIQEYLENSLKRNQAVLERVFLDKQADASRAGSYGISFGSIVNCLWAAQEKRLSVNVFALSGGNLPEIFMRSGDSLMKSYRQAALTVTQGNKELLFLHLQKLFTLDPLSAAASIQPEKTLLVLAMLDRVVPFRCGVALGKKMGNPETVFLPLGHYLALFAAPGLKWKIVRFFKEKFKTVTAV